MMNFKSLLVLCSLCVFSLGYAQNYSYDSYPQYPSQGYSNYQMQSGDYSQPYDQQGQFYGGGYQPQSYQQNRSYQQNPNSQQGYYQGGSSQYANKDQNQQVPDDMITRRVMQNIRSTPYLSPLARNAQVETKDGKVTLKGKVLNKNEGYQIEYMAKNVQGVKSVSNDFEYQK